MHSSCHEASQLEDAFNNLGIYPETPAALRSTSLTKEDIDKSQLTVNRLKHGHFGRQSWAWMSVLGELKCYGDRECAFDMNFDQIGPGAPLSSPTSGRMSSFHPHIASRCPEAIDNHAAAAEHDFFERSSSDQELCEARTRRAASR